MQHKGSSGSWSPDGRTILASAASTRPGIPALVYGVDAATGAAQPIGEPWGFIRDVQWLPDGRSFLATALDLSGMATPQIWQVAYPGGARTRVTNDLNSYIGASVASDGRTLATVQTETLASIYITDPSGKEPKRVTSGTGRADGNNGLAWTPDGRIVYSSTASGLPQLWITNADGSDVRQLTSTPGPSVAPWCSPDGQWIYFSSFAKEGSAIFRIAPDGSALTQLTHAGDARNPIVSADGRTVYLTGLRSGSPRLMKIPADGGTPEQVFDGYFRAQGISFDGSKLIGASWNEEQRRSEIAVLTLATKTVESMPDLPGATLFLPDGSLGVARRTQGKTSLMVQPLHGGAPRLLAPPDDQFVYGGAVARDGRVAFSRGISISDVVLIKAK